MNLNQKLQILAQARSAINRYIFDRTVVIAAHDEQTITDHGTGMLLRIGDDHLVITAAHVIRPYQPEKLQLVSTESPSNIRAAPFEGDLFGGESDEELDVGFLGLSTECVARLAGKSFLTLDDLELYPTDLSEDLAVLFGMPEAQHFQPRDNRHRYDSFTYFTNIPEDTDWTLPGPRPLELSIEYPSDVEDAFTRSNQTLPAPYGMSGGGLWRAHFKGTPIWTPGHMRVIGILTTHYCDFHTIRGNRVENLLHLLSLHYDAASQALHDA